MSTDIGYGTLRGEFAVFATIPFGRRRLVINLTSEPTTSEPTTSEPVEYSIAVGASDAELVRLAERRRDLEHARWDVWASQYGLRR
jgi:hypothetical protein